MYVCQSLFCIALHIHTHTHLHKQMKCPCLELQGNGNGKGNTKPQNDFSSWLLLLSLLFSLLLRFRLRCNIYNIFRSVDVLVIYFLSVLMDFQLNVLAVSTLFYTAVYILSPGTSIEKTRRFLALEASHIPTNNNRNEILQPKLFGVKLTMNLLRTHTTSFEIQLVNRWLLGD